MGGDRRLPGAIFRSKASSTLVPNARASRVATGSTSGDGYGGVVDLVQGKFLGVSFARLRPGGTKQVGAFPRRRRKAPSPPGLQWRGSTGKGNLQSM